VNSLNTKLRTTKDRLKEEESRTKLLEIQNQTLTREIDRTLNQKDTSTSIKILEEEKLECK
jgi:ribosomal protein S4E